MRGEPVPFDTGGRPLDQLANHIVGRKGERPQIGFVQAPTDPAHRMHLQTFGDVWSVVNQTTESLAQSVRQRVRECGKEDPGIGMRLGEMHGAVEGHDGLPCAGRTGDACRAAVSALDNSVLRRMQEDGPFLPRIFERPFQLLHVFHWAEPALRVRVSERVSVSGRMRRPLRRAAGREFQQCLRCFGRQVVGEFEQ